MVEVTPDGTILYDPHNNYMRESEEYVRLLLDEIKYLVNTKYKWGSY